MKGLFSHLHPGQTEAGRARGFGPGKEWGQEFGRWMGLGKQVPAAKVKSLVVFIAFNTKRGHVVRDKHCLCVPLVRSNAHM